MAKSKFPKKNNVVNEAVSTPNTPPPASTSNGSAAAAAPALEVQTSEAQTSETQKAAPRKTAKKPEIVKSEPRANLVPINLEEEIRRLAYLLSERRGFETGHEAEDWLAAEHEIRQRYHQHSA
jgi:hypothetical protein